jgi:hypothetical protein
VRQLAMRQGVADGSRQGEQLAGRGHESLPGYPNAAASLPFHGSLLTRQSASSR